MCLAGTTMWIHVCMVPAGHMVYVMSGRYYLLDHVDPCMHDAGREHGTCYVRPVPPSRPCGPMYAWCWPGTWCMLCPAGTTFSTIWTCVCMVLAEHMVHVISGRYHLLNHLYPHMHGAGRAHGTCYVRPVPPSRPCGPTYAWCRPGTWCMLCPASATFLTMWIHVRMVPAGHMVYVMSSRYYLLDHVDPRMHGASQAHGICCVQLVLPSRPCGPMYAWYRLGTWHVLCLASTTFLIMWTYVCLVLAGHMVDDLPGWYYILDYVELRMCGTGRTHGICYVRLVLYPRPS
jgi:hypothetical protein